MNRKKINGRLTIIVKKKNSGSAASSMDIISDLPDSLLQHILSFLDMKQVVQTCCLSKKWIDLWKSVPVLKFDFGNNSSYKNKVMNILHCVLDRRDDSKIQKLKLSGLWFSKPSEFSKLTGWLSVALKQHIEEVHLSHLLDNIYSSSKIYWDLPHFLFTSSTVKVLTYNHISPATVALKLPNSILTATQLMTLKLQGIRLIPGDFNGELILSCPVLETLSLKYCLNHDDLRILNISALRLKSLEICGYRGNGYHYKKHHKIKICTPNLTSLDLFHPNYNDFYLEDLRTLASANIRVDIHALSIECITGILNQLHNVSALELNILSRRVKDKLPMKTSPGSEGMLNQLQNPFLNLRKLSLNEICARGIVQCLLNLSPYIQILVMEMNKDDKGLYEELSLHKFNHLKFVRITYFNGDEKEYKLLSFILKNAVILESINITLFNKECLWQEVRDRIKEKLFSLPKASSNIRISFSINLMNTPHVFSKEKIQLYF